MRKMWAHTNRIVRRINRNEEVMKGHVISVGTMMVDGELLTDCFVECSVEDLKNSKVIIYRDVEIVEVKK